MRVVVAALLVGLVVADSYGRDALSDEIHSLPGAPAVPWRMFSGYIDVSRPDEANGTRQMFYWLVTSQGSPSTDPVILWTNGGPGCSGLSGFLTEQGPFRATSGGKTLELNEFAWNKVANMVFIEQPVGVGFSTVKGDVTYGDAEAAADNHRFVVGFFRRYSQFISQDFFISSESYGGHYMPTLAKSLVEGEAVKNFRGVFLGNPLTYMPYRNYGQYGTAYGHQLLPQPLWEKYTAAGCKTSFPVSDACASITSDMDKILSGFDPYALDFATCTTAEAAGRQERWTLRKVILRAQAASRGETALLGDAPYQPCSEAFSADYLNRADVQSAIHVKSGAQWAMCNDHVGSAYNMTDVNAPMMPVWTWLIKNTNLKMMIYSGDDDSVCATLGSQQFVWDLGFHSKSGATWAPWKVDSQVAGFQTDFETASTAAFSFVTVHGAGHMVPATQPARSLSLLKKFLGEKESQTLTV